MKPLSEAGAHARTVACPYCHAPVGEACRFVGRRKQRGYIPTTGGQTHPHLGRRKAAGITP